MKLLSEHGDVAQVIDVVEQRKLTEETSGVHSVKKLAIEHGITMDKSAVHLCVLDVVYIPEKEMLALACSDRGISLWQIPVANTAGGIFNSGRDGIFVCVHQLSHPGQNDVAITKLCWNQAGEVLCAVGTDHKIYLWDLQTKMIRMVLAKHKVQ
jgi:WD40 repeat protein